ncbi:hypothetical protein CXG81DRAFT_27204 [Caulochytrium protostelioides]|uniref:Pre-rRNA-processing protein Ipi1 N-terminal domain-containing protein n=1 Tax=Caulochytrium protostelioides TaxID=1555241 RepID=A0A4V1IUC4_9FUNG|nr:hypothetical protein CXG81DRAFT_27204 [Caulochytrium protostelioides]|eukprot:RKP00069.1 hypothetical protein CXG81DRAFT_27204 [Caulochytrium protostelioides]
MTSSLKKKKNSKDFKKKKVKLGRKLEPQVLTKVKIQTKQIALPQQKAVQYQNANAAVSLAAAALPKLKQRTAATAVPTGKRGRDDDAAAAAAPPAGAAAAKAAAAAKTAAVKTAEPTAAARAASQRHGPAAVTRADAQSAAKRLKGAQPTYAQRDADGDGTAPITSGHADSDFAAMDGVMGSTLLTDEQLLARPEVWRQRVADQLQKTGHYTAHTRKEALRALQTLLETKPLPRPEHRARRIDPYRIAPLALCQPILKRMLDEDAGVRVAAFHVLEHVVTSHGAAAGRHLAPVLPLALATTRMAMSHIQADVRADAVRFMTLWVTHFADRVAESRALAVLLDLVSDLLAYTLQLNGTRTLELGGLSREKPAAASGSAAAGQRPKSRRAGGGLASSDKAATQLVVILRLAQKLFRLVQGKTATSAEAATAAATAAAEERADGRFHHWSAPMSQVLADGAETALAVPSPAQALGLVSAAPSAAATVTSAPAAAPSHRYAIVETPQLAQSRAHETDRLRRRQQQQRQSGSLQVVRQQVPLATRLPTAQRLFPLLIHVFLESSAVVLEAQGSGGAGGAAAAAAAIHVPLLSQVIALLVDVTDYLLSPCDGDAVALTEPAPPPPTTVLAAGASRVAAMGSDTIRQNAAATMADALTAWQHAAYVLIQRHVLPLFPLQRAMFTGPMGAVSVVDDDAEKGEAALSVAAMLDAMNLGVCRLLTEFWKANEALAASTAAPANASSTAVTADAAASKRTIKKIGSVLAQLLHLDTAESRGRAMPPPSTLRGILAILDAVQAIPPAGQEGSSDGDDAALVLVAADPAWHAALLPIWQALQALAVQYPLQRPGRSGAEADGQDATSLCHHQLFHWWRRQTDHWFTGLVAYAAAVEADARAGQPALTPAAVRAERELIQLGLDLFTPWLTSLPKRLWQLKAAATSRAQPVAASTARSLAILACMNDVIRDDRLHRVHQRLAALPAPRPSEKTAAGLPAPIQVPQLWAQALMPLFGMYVPTTTTTTTTTADPASKAFRVGPFARFSATLRIRTAETVAACCTRALRHAVAATAIRQGDAASAAAADAALQEVRAVVEHVWTHIETALAALAATDAETTTGAAGATSALPPSDAAALRSATAYIVFLREAVVGPVLAAATVDALTVVPR